MIFKTFLNQRETKKLQNARDVFRSINKGDDSYGCLTNINVATGNVDVMFLKPKDFTAIRNFVLKRVKFDI